jgi:GNAT superfamily N-acetyltransferase
MPLAFEPVSTPVQVARLSAVADEIWHEYWPPRIGMAQTDYMVRMFQAPAAIERDMAEHGYRYWLLHDGQGNLVGYTGGTGEELSGDAEADAAMMRSAVVDERWPRRFFISKIYLYATERGKRYSSRVMSFYEDICRNEGFPALYLTVNRDNDLAVRAYVARGLEVVEEADNPIGGGFVMTDYIMAKEIQRR